MFKRRFFLCKPTFRIKTVTPLVIDVRGCFFIQMFRGWKDFEAKFCWLHNQMMDVLTKPKRERQMEILSLIWLRGLALLLCFIVFTLQIAQLFYIFATEVELNRIFLLYQEALQKACYSTLKRKYIDLDYICWYRQRFNFSLVDICWKILKVARKRFSGNME